MLSSFVSLNFDFLICKWGKTAEKEESFWDVLVKKTFTLLVEWLVILVFAYCPQIIINSNLIHPQKYPGLHVKCYHHIYSVAERIKWDSVWCDVSSIYLSYE